MTVTWDNPPSGPSFYYKLLGLSILAYLFRMAATRESKLTRSSRNASESRTEAVTVLDSFYVARGLSDTEWRARPSRASFYAASLQKHEYLKVESSHNITHFVHDAVTGAMFAGLAFKGSGARLSEWTEIRGYPVPSNLHRHSTRAYASTAHQSLDFIPAQLTSMTLSSRRTLLTTCLGNTVMLSHAKARIRQLADPNVGSHYLTEDLGTHFDLPRQTDIWCSAASPTGDAFALGGSNGLELLTQNQVQWLSETNRLLGHAEITAMEFQSNNTIMAGQRNGAIQFLDRRSGGKALRLAHPSAMIALRMVDDYRVVVCGLLSSLCMYDLRFTNTVATHLTKKNASSSAAAHATMPYLSFPQYNNTYRRDLGFDIDREFGIVAGGTDDGKVKLFSLQTGGPVESALTNSHMDGLSSCVRFARATATLSREYVEIENDPKSLLVAGANVVEEWHCRAGEHEFD